MKIDEWTIWELLDAACFISLILVVFLLLCMAWAAQ
jgi:hypothetical protein